MKRKIALLLITGICLANTVPCFASPSMKVSVSSSEENQYSTLPDGDTLQKDVGFRPKAPASLAGGYLFGSGILRNHLILIQMALLSTNRKV